MIKLGILGSTRGTHLHTIQQAIVEKKLSAEIAMVISNKVDAFILERAKGAHLPALFIDPHNKTREQYDAEVSVVLAAAHVDLIVLIGYMRILSKSFTQRWHNKIINVHPSLLPAHKGLMDLQVHQAVLNAHEKESGCTVHYVTEEVDAGPIIIQKKCPVLPTDNPESLKARIQILEGEALVEALVTLTRES